ncbi:MAG: BofC C-terminal domain-containing protein [Acutalibacteraceae bacterium]|nr:BofC C-terminal domain-containing protein [Acutalibacteraceae bacterium]
MNKKFIIVALIITVTLAVIIASVLVINHSKDNYSNPILKEDGGQVKLFRNGNVVAIYDDIVIDILPPDDREALKKGIEIKNEEELLSIIEDYDG